MKQVYTFDEDGYFNGSKQVDDNYKLSASETFDKPKYATKGTTKRENGQWVYSNPESIVEEKEADNPSDPMELKPSENQRFQSSVMKQLMQLQLAYKQQNITMATLTKQLMALQLKGANA
ncbi:hypothetical protein [Limosilactobacillus reuteri]